MCMLYFVTTAVLCEHVRWKGGGGGGRGGLT